MGASQFQYSTPVGEKNQGESHVYRHPDFVNGLNDNFNSMTNLQQILIQNSQKYAKNNLLGSQVITGKHSRHYAYKNYSQCFERAKLLGQGIIVKNLIPQVQSYLNHNLKMVGVFSKNREEWMLLEYANILYGNTMIPLYDTLGPEAIPFVLNQSQIVSIFCSGQSLNTLLKVADLGGLKNIVSFDDINEEIKQRVEEKGLNIYTFNEIIEAGQSLKEPIPFAEVNKDDIFTFSYTSGTTGTPKGVMISHHNMVVTIAAIACRNITLNEKDVHLSYLPLPHVYELVFSMSLMAHGATICFYGGDVMKISQDLALVKPTIFASVPRLYQRLYQVIKEKLDKLTGVQKTMFEYAYNTKMYHLKRGGHVTHKLWDKLIFAKTREAFGGRVKLMFTASAPISGEILDFIKIVACCPVLEGYGQTESTGGSFLTDANDPLSNHVGGPLSHTEFKLVDVEEMKYLSTDVDEKGQPQPRGEVCIRGPGVFQGYYKEQDKTNETIDEQGWLHTGDISVLLPNGSIKIVDRKKNIFKLSQGEYIAPEKIENIYAKVKGVQEVFVYGDSLQAYCVCILVPKKEVVEELARAKGILGLFEDLCKNAEIVAHFLKEINAQGKIDRLNGMENVKRLYLEPVSFVEHGCMTNTLKLQRHLAKQTFKSVIDQLYQD